MKKWIINYRVSVLFAVFALIPLFSLGEGNPLRYDWVWPFFDMKQFWGSLINDSSFGLFSALSRIGSALFGLFGLIHLSPTLSFKIFIFLVHFISGYGFYRFIRSRVKSETVAIVASFAYAFSPYIFIRTIVGFVWSMVAYAVLPIFLTKFLQTKKKIFDHIIIGFLFSLIFGQTQAGLLTIFIITVYLIITSFGRARIDVIKNYSLTIISLFVFALPWAIVMLFCQTNLSVISGNVATSIGYMSSVPHSFRNMFMLSDHQITAGFFYPLAHNKLFILGWLIVWFVAFCAIFSKKNRELVLTFVISCLVVLPFIKGPVGKFGNFYIWFYNHFPQIAVFRETYHFEFLYAIALCIMFAVGLDWLWRSISMLKLKVESEKLRAVLKVAMKTLFTGSTIFIIVPYLTFDYAGYLKLQKIPAEYTELYNFLQQDKNYCQKIYYPPGLGFLYFKDDKTLAASNSDMVAYSMRISYLDDGTTYSYPPTIERFYRNEVVSQFYEKEKDDGQLVGLLEEGAIDCVILRLDTESKYNYASSLWQEKEPAIVKKWNNIYLKELVESKEGMKLEKQFGENIFIYKVDKEFQVSSIKFQVEKEQAVGKSTNKQFVSPDNLQPARPAGGLTTYNLPLTDWANNWAYYKNGWSRGRYDFWRKHLFTRLRQDFIYTDKGDSVLTGKIDKRGSYEVWSRYLTGGMSGSYQLTVNGKQFMVAKDSGDERFIWKKLGDIQLDGQADVEIKNINGENAIADLVLVER